VRERWVVLAVVLTLAAGACRVEPGVPATPLPGLAATAQAEPLANRLIADRLPRVDYLGGPFLRNPRPVTVTFAHDDDTTVGRLESFGAMITRTGWWGTATAGYCAAPGDCIGPGTSGRSVRLDEVLPARVDDVELEQILVRLADAGSLGPLEADSLVLAYLPAGVVLTEALMGRYCAGGPRAYHRALRSDAGAQVAYAVIPRCGDVDRLTATASHEILEATTNPDPADRGFAFQRDSRTAGFTAAGVEPADPCSLISRGDQTTVEFGFTVQRVWSNRAAAAGHHPCAPHPDRPYLALVPRQPAVRLPRVGGETVAVLDARSDRRVHGWSVSAVDLTSAPRDCVALRLDRNAVTRGSVVRLRITLLHRSIDDQCLVGLLSTHGGRTDVWPLAVMTR